MGALEQQLYRLQKWKMRVDRARNGVDALYREAGEAAAAKGLAAVRALTPVRTGRLQMGWQKRVSRTGSSYQVSLLNEVAYAPYVEFGHRAGKSGFVPGRYMMSRGRIAAQTALAMEVARAEAKILTQVKQ